MSGQKPTWVIDSSRFATKIRSASGLCHPEQVDWKSNPTKSCPNCQYVIDNSEVADVWPGLPRGVKFDPSDQEIIWHLLAKSGVSNYKLHPFLDEFIPTVEEEDGICYTHPSNLPGVRQDGSVSHFFHRAIKAYNTGTRKRRKILDDDLGDVRWHKTGRTKPVVLDSVQEGCKKIMVLYVSPVRGGKAQKTNWVMHQYHLGTGEDEKDGEYVISKVFYQQQQQAKKQKEEGIMDVFIAKVDPVTPKLVTPEPLSTERRSSSNENSMLTVLQHHKEIHMECEEVETHPVQANAHYGNMENNDDAFLEEAKHDEESKWWENESQFLLNSQQLLEGISICDEFLQGQSPSRENDDQVEDLEECQNSVLDPANIELETPPDFRLSQLEFDSQDSYIAWGAGVNTQSK